MGCWKKYKVEFGYIKPGCPFITTKWIINIPCPYYNYNPAFTYSWDFHISYFLGYFFEKIRKTEEQCDNECQLRNSKLAEDWEHIIVLSYELIFDTENGNKN